VDAYLRVGIEWLARLAAQTNVHGAKRVSCDAIVGIQRPSHCVGRRADVLVLHGGIELAGEVVVASIGH
jgi:hypothetical protein